MSNGFDGGQRALAGYLYQIVGVLGMQARAHGSDSAPDSSELEALLSLVRTGQLLHEYLDQDAVLHQLGIGGGDDYVLVQFKYSSQTPPPTIGPKELTKIVSRLSRGAEQARGIDENTLGYTLITNRNLGPQAQALKGAAERGEAPCDLSASQCLVLVQLRVITNLRMTEWQEALESFAQRFGAEEDDIERGINCLIGDLVRRTAELGDAPVSNSDLIDAFTEYDCTRPLTLESIAEISSLGLNRFIDEHGLPGKPVRRRLLDEIARVSSQRALVVLHGLGGCGKTIALWQWANETATAQPPRGRPSTAISAAGVIPHHWITQTICDWAGLPPINHRRRAEEPDRAIQRLQIALAGESQPILFLGLDGLDESIGDASQGRIVRDLLRWFWEEDEEARQEARPPKAALVVTCRSAEEVIEDWLRLDVSGYGYRGIRPEEVKVLDFLPEELIEAARVGLPALSGRIETTLQSLGLQPEASVFDQRPAMLGEINPYVRGANEEILEVLMHPAMWRALLELEPDVQSQVLDNEFLAVQQLAEVFIRRFCIKVIVRDRLPGVNEDVLLDVLCAIARHSVNAGGIRQHISSWFDPALGTYWIGGSGEARILYSEALSGGMIVDDGEYWQWRHRLVWDHLAGLDEAHLGPRGL
jgi:hypothetical protein